MGRGRKLKSPADAGLVLIYGDDVEVQDDDGGDGDNVVSVEDNSSDVYGDDDV